MAKVVICTALTFHLFLGHRNSLTNFRPDDCFCHTFDKVKNLIRWSGSVSGLFRLYSRRKSIDRFGKRSCTNVSSCPYAEMNVWILSQRQIKCRQLKNFSSRIPPVTISITRWLTSERNSWFRKFIDSWPVAPGTLFVWEYILSRRKG